MSTTRLEAFSDGVIAILITIMVLELRPPGGDTVHALFEGHLAAKLDRKSTRLNSSHT